jgi:hypothetical protein
MPKSGKTPDSSVNWDEVFPSEETEGRTTSGPPKRGDKKPLPNTISTVQLDDDWTVEEEAGLQKLLRRWRAKQPRDQYNDDLALAVGLLAGAWTQQGAKPDSKKEDRHPAKRYFVDRSHLDKEARAAIGRLLRRSEALDNHLRFLLAELFDGLPPHASFDGMPVARRIVFDRRSSGEPTETKLRNHHIASDYKRMITEQKLKPKRAIGKLCDKYGFKITVIKGALKANRELLSMPKKVGQKGR